MDKKISSTFGILVILIIAITIGITFWLVEKENLRLKDSTIEIKNSNIKQNNDPEQSNISCADDIKKCSNGSYVSRTAPDCEFEKCPEETNWSFTDGKLRDYKYGFSGDLPKNFFVEDEWDEISNKAGFERIFRISNYKDKFSIVDTPNDLILFYLFIEKKDNCQEANENINEWKSEFKNKNIENICEKDDNCYVIPHTTPLVVESFCYKLSGSMSRPDTSDLNLINYKLKIIKEFAESIKF